MTNQTNPAAPQTVGAREVIQAHLAVLDEWAAQNGGTDGTLESISKEDTPTARWVGPQVARSALALKALLSAPSGAGTRLAEAAKECLTARNGQVPWEMLRAALAAFRASPEAIGGGRADADDMRAQRDHNAATAVRTQTEWRKALLAITPPGVTWPESKPTEIATLTEATAEIGAAHAETRKALGHVRSNVKSIVAEREAIAKERDTLRAERDAANAALDKAQDGNEAQRKANGALRAERDRLAGAQQEVADRSNLLWGVRIFTGQIVAAMQDHDEAVKVSRSYGWNKGEVVQIGKAPTVAPQDKADLPRQETVKGGTITSYTGTRLRLFECEACGFAFDASHGNASVGWSCPVCELAEKADPAPAEAPREAASEVSERAKAFREVVAKLDSVKADQVSPARLAGYFETWAEAAERGER